jgi:hypothetical protein
VIRAQTYDSSVSKPLFDPWPMNVFTKGEAEWAYEQRKFLKRTDKEIARELGKSERSTQRAIGYISLERGTYSYSAWRQELREFKRQRCYWFLRTVTEQARKDKLAKQSAAEHLAMSELTRAALEHSPPRETRAEREQRVEREAMSGTVPIMADDGDTIGEQHGRGASRRLAPSEREARRKARRIKEMLGSTATPQELGLE